MYIGCLSVESFPSPTSDAPHTPMLKPTVPGIACQIHGESRRPLFGSHPSQKKEREHGVEIDFAAPVVKQKSPFPWPVALGNQSGGELRRRRVEFQGLL